LLRESTEGLEDAARESLLATIAWHEYGHALSLTCSTSEQRSSGVRLLGLLPEGMRASIDFPTGYRASQVFDEVIATVYAVMVDRAVRTCDYGPPEYLHPDVLKAFKEVIPWPPSR
jgi:hypothetical protein